MSYGSCDVCTDRLMPADFLLSSAARQLLQDERQARAREYVWKLDSGCIIDPTNATGHLESHVPWLGNDFLFSSSPPNDMPLPLPAASSSPLLSACPPAQSTQPASSAQYPVPTVLCRINEPARGGDVNVITEEREGQVLFVCETGIKAGQELLLDYGPYYDRSKYSSEVRTWFPSDA